MTASAAPKFADAPSVDEMEALTCPVDRVRRISRFARLCGTLPRPLARIRKSALIEARQAGWLVEDLAAEFGIASARVSAITGRIVRPTTLATPPTSEATP